MTAEAAWRRRTRTPVLLATTVAWVALAATTATQGSSMSGSATDGGTGRGIDSMGGMDGIGSMSGSTSLSVWMAGLMVAAMMTPLLIPAVRHAAARSLRRRRRRAVSLLVMAHLAVWFAGAVALQATAPWLLGHLGSVAAPAIGLTVAAVWQMSPLAQRWSNQHHALPPLAPFGAKADLDLMTFGTRHAATCLGACWVLMLWPALTGRYQLAAMAIAAAWVWAQALEPPTRPRWRIWIPRKTGRLVGSLWGSLTRTPRGASAH